MPFADGHGQETQKYKFGGKEFDTMHGLNQYDFHARQYDPTTLQFKTPDPLAEKYYSWSLYAYVMNNPMKYIDPTGMVVDSVNLEQWNGEKQNIYNRLLELNSSNIDGMNNEQIRSLQGTLKIMRQAEGSSQLYKLGGISGNIGGVTYDDTSKAILISYGGTANFVHEVTHVGQFESGDIAFSKTGGSLAQDIFDEIAAYKAQYNYDPNSVSGLSSTSTVNSLNDITTSWVQGINGGTIYRPSGTAKTGIAPLNIYSTKIDFIRSMGIYGNYKNMIMDVPLYLYPGVHYKK